MAALILSGRESSNLLLSILFGFAFFITGLFVMASAWVVRYERWRWVFIGGMAQLRKRATTMAWTPGLMLDYARALHALVHPVHISWFERWRQLDRPQQ